MYAGDPPSDMCPGHAPSGFDFMKLCGPLANRILSSVEKPSRYLGIEANRVLRPDAEVQLRIALVFPDLIDLGLGNLGLQVLYAVLNRLPGVQAERVYAPAEDMAAALSRHDARLFGLESRESLDAFDGVGFSLQSELTYTNVPWILELSGIPLRSSQRGEDDPIVFAGGPCTVNPEPMAPFFDFLAIGDGEDLAVDVADTLLKTKGQSRTRRLEALSGIDGVYVPGLFPADGRPTVRRRVVLDLDRAMLPEAPVVALTRLVHDRLSIEVQRGCTRGCRFCQAGATNRPIRERSPDTVIASMDAGLSATGWEEVAFVSLSTSDHSRIAEIVARAAAGARPAGVSLSLPSLRLDNFSMDLAQATSCLRRTGLTFAPEAATSRMRAVINKQIPDRDLLLAVEEAASRGWDHVKLYFMIGLPTETDDDVDAIADLAIRALQAGRSRNRRFGLHLGVSTFVPRPWTPFQWAAQIPPDEARRRQERLGAALRGFPAIRFGRHPIDESFIEGLLSRADQSGSVLVEAAWRLGCRFDGWNEHRRADLWKKAVEETGFDEARALGPRPIEAVLPWDFLDVGPTRAFLESEWRRALAGELTSDCRSGGCQGCGQDRFLEGPCTPDLSPDAPVTPSPAAAPRPSGTAVQRVVLRLRRMDLARFLSNQETMTAFSRALGRARVPLAFSEGFHAHPKVAFSSAFPVGEESEGDYVDLLLTTRMDVFDLAAKLCQALPEGLSIVETGELPPGAPALMAQVAGARYRIRFEQDEDEPTLFDRVFGIMSAEELLVVRKPGRHEAPCDIRPGIRHMAVSRTDEGTLVLDLETVVVAGRAARPRDVLGLLAPLIPYPITRKLECLVSVMPGGQGRAGDVDLVPFALRWGLAPFQPLGAS
jgi:radical SAM family uncharacterized protein/radical SAM-linked protein